MINIYCLKRILFCYLIYKNFTPYLVLQELYGFTSSVSFYKLTFSLIKSFVQYIVYPVKNFNKVERVQVICTVQNFKSTRTVAGWRGVT